MKQSNFLSAPPPAHFCAETNKDVLSIDLVREIPEALKPRKIDIQTSPALQHKVAPAQIEAQKAA